MDLSRCSIARCCLLGSNTAKIDSELQYETFYASLFENLAEMWRLRGVFLSEWTFSPVISSKFLLLELDSYFLILHVFR